MSLNLQELIIFREEAGRELTHHEVDNNFKKVANPWDATREYFSQDVVFYPVGNGPVGNGLDVYMYVNNVSTIAPAPVGANPPSNLFNGTEGWVKIGTGTIATSQCMCQVTLYEP